MRDPVALACWANKDAVLAALFAQVDALANDDAALGPEEREAETGRLSKALRSLNRREEILIRAAEAEGTDINRRPDADVYAVLGLSDDK